MYIYLPQWSNLEDHNDAIVDSDKSKYEQQCKIKNQLEDHWFASFRSLIDLPQAIYSKSE